MPKCNSAEQKEKRRQYYENLKYQKCNICRSPADWFDRTGSNPDNYWCNQHLPNDGCPEEYGAIRR